MDRVLRVRKNAVANSCVEQKHKMVHFSSHITQIIPRKVNSDEQHRLMSFEVANKSKISCRTNKSNICFNENGELKSPSSTITSKCNENRIPVYTQSAISRSSFRLTPPNVTDKNAVYEFEVDENEEPRVKKKRRIKTYKEKKRVLFKNMNVKSYHMMNDVPQRTVILRTDKEVNCNTATKITELHKPVKTDSVSVRETSKNSIISIEQIKAHSYVKNTLKKPITEQSNTTTHNLNEQNLSQITKNLNTSYKTCNVDNCSANKNIIEISNDITPQNNFNEFSHDGNDNGNAVAVTFHSNHIVNSSILSPDSRPPDDASVCTSNLQSPLPEHSRLDEGIQVGPLCTSSINSSDVDYNNHFVKRLTASTPVRSTFCLARIHNSQVHLSEGDLKNKYISHFDYDSNNDDDDDEQAEFNGFDFDTCNSDSVGSINLNNQISVTNNREQLVENLPIQQTSIREIISLLKKEVENESTVSKKRGRKLPKAIYEYNTVNRRPAFCNSSLDCYDHSNKSRCESSSVTDIDVTGQERQKGANHEDDKENHIEADRHFTKPPRRSYSITPRRKKQLECKELYENEQKEEEHQNTKVKTRYKRCHRTSKKKCCNICEIFRKFCSVISSLQNFWSVYESLREKAWVIDPEYPKKRDTYSRIVIGENASVLVSINPAEVSSFPEIKFLGADKAVAPFRKTLEDNLQLFGWDINRSLVDNLLTILGFDEFPLPVSPSSSQKKNTRSSQDDLLVDDQECSICFMLRAQDNMLPTKICNNDKCTSVFHLLCLAQWFQSVPTNEPTFNVISGDCPHCGKCCAQHKARM
ncbi:uncharacterized protein LOC142324763 isoform X2 [Lycorma delicatula]|uniref:uncharacterized protein LOC142324763 isoform X2 n=1 Tax=Lycorma delicatula TaxID=130591 RepID=UPI003F517CCF